MTAWLVDGDGGFFSAVFRRERREEEVARRARGPPGKLDGEIAVLTSFSPKNSGRSLCVHTSHDEIMINEYFNDYLIPKLKNIIKNNII